MLPGSRPRASRQDNSTVPGAHTPNGALGCPVTKAVAGVPWSLHFPPCCALPHSNALTESRNRGQSCQKCPNGARPFLRGDGALLCPLTGLARECSCLTRDFQITGP